MKRILFAHLFSIGLLIPVTAQITITNAVFPVVGDTFYFAIDDQPQGIVMGPPGFDLFWDFSNLQRSSTRRQTFQSAQSGADFGSFPSATMMYTTPDETVEVYLNASANEVSMLGLSGPDPLILGLDLAAKFNPPIVQSRAPVNFFDIRQISSGLLLPFLPSLLPGVEFLPFTADSMRIRIAFNRLDVVDGYGTASIPGGTFNVLREKRTEYRERRLDAKISPLGWLDVTDTANQYLGLGLGVDTTVTYHFLNDQSKEPIAICTTDNSQLRVISVQYKDLPSRVQPVVYLQGAYETGTGLMRDDLRAQHLLPLEEPYASLGYIHLGGGGERTQQAVLDISGANAIVDWVFVEARDPSNHAIVKATRSALLQRDGDVVEIDGVSPVIFGGLPAGGYYVAVKHRNHLGVMSAAPVALSGSATVVNFTGNVNTTFGGANGIKALGNGLFGLYGGDFNHNGQVQNTDYASMVLTLGASGYQSGDLDLNGQVQNTDLQLRLIPNIGKGQAFGQ
jgi:hypothetical protein